MPGSRVGRWPLWVGLGFAALVAGAVWALTLGRDSLPLQQRVRVGEGEVLVNLWREGSAPGEVRLIAQVTDLQGVPLPPSALAFRVGPDSPLVQGRREGWEAGGRYAYVARVRLEGSGPWTVTVRFSYGEEEWAEARFLLEP